MKALAEAVPILERTPAVLRTWLGALDARWLDTDEGPDTFSPREVLGHLLQGEAHDWIPRLTMILREDPAPFPPFDRFAHRAAYAGWPHDRLLAAFAEARAASLDALQGLVPDDAMLDRRGRHPDLGPVTGRQLLATWVAHDLGHLAQIGRVMAKRYREAVGPWRVYLPVMDR